MTKSQSCGAGCAAFLKSKSEFKDEKLYPLAVEASDSPMGRVPWVVVPLVKRVQR